MVVWSYAGYWLNLRGLWLKFKVLCPYLTLLFAHVYHYAISELSAKASVPSQWGLTRLESPPLIHRSGFDHRRERRRLEYMPSSPQRCGDGEVSVGAV